MRTKPIEEAITSYAPGKRAVLTVEYQPGNGSRYRLTFVYMDDHFLVSLHTAGHGTCMTVQHPGGHVSAQYVEEKLKVSRADAVVLAELIAHETERTADDASNPESYK